MSNCCPHKNEIWTQWHTKYGQGVERRQPSKTTGIHIGDQTWRHLILDFSLLSGGKQPACGILWCRYANPHTLGWGQDLSSAAPCPKISLLSFTVFSACCCPCLTPWLACSCGRSFLNQWPARTFSIEVPLTVYITCASGLGATQSWFDNQWTCWSLYLPI